MLTFSELVGKRKEQNTRIARISRDQKVVSVILSKTFFGNKAIQIEAF